ncbi:MAG TPA: two-component regulator propeller domain-containing protein, partial [Prolixibacteraceae bacterium]|nr:two-component regulator propeller domain-containing protein [Prolixibacteraceae bacterium]
MTEKFQKILITLSLLLIMFTGYTFGQQEVFNKLTPPAGQNFSPVDNLTQDINGTIWIGTQNGVYSYDGLELKTFKNNPLNPNSLANGFTLSLCTDNKGMIWIGTLGGGLEMLNPATGDFTHFVNDPNNPASLSNDTVPALLIDNEGTLWVGTHGGLDKFDSKTNTFIHYKYNVNDSTGLSNNQVRVLYEDRNGTLWIGTGSPWTGDGGEPDAGGLNKLNKETGTFTQYLHDPNNTNSLFNNKVNAIFEDNSGTLWIGTWKNGIQKLDREKGTFEQMFSDTELPEKFIKADPSNPGIDYDYITFFNQDVAGNIWFGTFANGLYKYDTENEEIINFDETENSSSGYSGNSPASSFNSRDDILWIGANGNIYYTDPLIKKIQHTSVQGSSVSSFYEEENGDFWIGTFNEIVRNIRNSADTKRYETEDYKFNAPYNLGYRINGDREGNIWAGTTEGLNRFDKKTEKFIVYKHDPENKNSISSNHAIITYEDSKSNFWVGTINGLNLLDRKTGLFQRYYAHPENTQEGINNVILSIVEDKSDFLWIGNWRGMGINRFNPESKTFKDYLKGATVWLLFLDSDDILWAGTEQGVYYYEPNIDEFVPFTADGLVVNIQGATSMLEDKQKNIWLTTSNQIIRINPGRNEVSRFGENYGVGQNDFNFQSGYIRRNGEIYFGDKTGYFSFFPDELIKSLKAPELVFTGMSLSDTKLEPGDGGPLNESLNNQKEIRLAYNQNVFSIDHAIIDYANPEQNRLTYFLENFDINWHNANSERRAYYFNVPPGNYTFRVKGVNSYGAWAEKTIDIIIMPPWWRTWLAYVVYAILFIALVFGIDRFQRRRIMQKEKQKNRERELAHAKEIEKAYTELGVAHENLKSTQSQLIQSEKMASLGELTAGIAHEIQNPLNFVNNFSEVNKELIVELKDEIDKQNYDEAKEIANNVEENEGKIIYHGKRAESIVKG